MTAPIVVRTGGTGEALQQIGEAVGQIRDPNKEQREQFQRFLVQTPGALDTLAQNFRDNPEAVQAALPFVPPEVLAQIGETPQTSGQQLEDITTESFASMQQEQRELTGITRILREIGTNPEEFASLNERLDFLNQRLKDPEGQALVQRGVERRLGGGETAAQRAQGDVAQDVAERAFARMQVLPQAQVDEAALRNQLEEYFFDEDNRLAHAQRLELAGLTGPGAAAPDALTRARLNAERTESIRQARETNVGTEAVWNTFLFDRTTGPDGRTPNERAIGLAQGTIPVTSAEDAELAAVGSAWLRQGEVRRNGEISSQLAVIERLADSIEERDSNGNLRLRATREAFIEQLNAAFAMAHNLSKTPENPEGTIPLREAFIPGTRNAPFRVRDPVTQEELRVDTGPGFLQRLWSSTVGRFGRSAPTARGGEQPQSRVEEERSQTFLQPPTDIPPRTVENLPDFSPITVDMGLLSSETSIANLLVLQEGRGTFKQLMDNNPSGAIDLLRALNPEFQNEGVQALIDSLIRVEVLKREDTRQKPEPPDVQGGVNQ